MTRWLFAIAVLAACEGRDEPRADEPATHAVAAKPAPRLDSRPLAMIDSVSGIAECDALLDKFESFAHCGALPHATRDSLGNAATQVRQSFRQLREIPPESKRATALACGQAIDQVQQAAREAGCRL